MLCEVKIVILIYKNENWRVTRMIYLFGEYKFLKQITIIELLIIIVSVFRCFRYVYTLRICVWGSSYLCRNWNYSNAVVASRLVAVQLFIGLFSA